MSEHSTGPSQPQLGDYTAFENGERAAIEAGDPTALLIAEHEWLRSVLNELKARLAPANDEQRLTLRAQVHALGAQIDLHIRKEEDVYFPALEPLLQEASQVSTMDMYGEHDAIRIRHDRLDKAVTENIDIPHVFNEFSRSLTIHFANEEEMIFEAAPERLSQSESRRLVDEMQALKRGRKGVAE